MALMYASQHHRFIFVPPYTLSCDVILIVVGIFHGNVVLQGNIGICWVDYISIIHNQNVNSSVSLVDASYV